MGTLFIDRLSIVKDGRPIIRDLTLFADPGEIVGLVADNVQSLTELVELLAGHPKPGLSVTGMVLFGNQNLLAPKGVDPSSAGHQSKIVNCPDTNSQLVLYPKPFDQNEPPRVPAEYDGATVIIVGERIDQLTTQCKSLAVFCNGSLMERRPAEAPLDARAHPFTHAIWRNNPDLIGGQGTGCPYVPNCDKSVTGCTSADLKQQMIDVDHSTACIRWRDLA